MGKQIKSKITFYCGSIKYHKSVYYNHQKGNREFKQTIVGQANLRNLSFRELGREENMCGQKVNPYCLIISRLTNKSDRYEDQIHGKLKKEYHEFKLA